MTEAEGYDFESSVLGTRSYWDEIYAKELQIFADNDEDTGEVWFGHSCMMRVVRWVCKCKEQQNKEDMSVLDIGCGNGVFLTALAEEGFNSLYGLDYSDTGVELARKISEKDGHNIMYKQADFLDSQSINFTLKHFDICHDKGTYDAISLRPDDACEARQQYKKTLREILDTGGWFVITSCNWTLEELKDHFATGFTFVHTIPAPSLKFGGQTGSTVATAIFQKN